MTWPRVLTDGLCFVGELQKFNINYIHSATMQFTQTQPEGILLPARWVAALLGCAEWTWD